MCKIKIKKDKNNSYFLAFYNSALFWPFVSFFIIILINQILFFQNNYIDYNWRYLLAFFGGLNHDLFIFSLTALILAFLWEYFPKLFNIKLSKENCHCEALKTPWQSIIVKSYSKIFKLLSLIILHIYFCLPIFDYLYFNATLERFNWVVLKFINYHSAKGYIENMGSGFFILIIFFLFLIISIYFNNKKEYLAETYSFKLLGSICIFTFFASLFTNNIGYSKKSVEKDGVYWNWDLQVAGGKNLIIKSLYSGSVLGFLTNKQVSIKSSEFKPYTDKEKAFLESHGFLPISNSTMLQPNYIKPPCFNKVIMIVLESFPLEYIHAINPNIPGEATPFFDYLINNYPHSKNYYTSDFPTLLGLSALLCSKVPFKEYAITKQSYNLASMHEENRLNSSWFINGQSNYYGDERSMFKNIFGFSNYIGYEDLAKLYSETGGSSWGADDEILYDFAYNRLLEIKNNNYFMVIKLINQHLPIFSYVVNKKDQPDEVKSHSNEIVKVIYDADKLLKDFIKRCEKDNIIDEKTLIVITADHYPPLGRVNTELYVKSNSLFQLDKLPLIFHSKNKEVFKNFDSEKLCCQLDVAPTLCYLLGLDIPKEHMGQNLLSTNYKPRSIGILNNETLYFKSEFLSFSDSITNPATSTPAIRKWINNLWSNE